jgi:hypothetical protein
LLILRARGFAVRIARGYRALPGDNIVASEMRRFPQSRSS